MHKLFKSFGIILLVVALVGFFTPVMAHDNPGKGGGHGYDDGHGPGKGKGKGHHGGRHGGGHCGNNDTQSNDTSVESTDPNGIESYGCDTDWERATYPGCYGLPYFLLLQDNDPTTEDGAIEVQRVGFPGINM